ncbi:hypothetical protein COCSADRAFT_176001 [Bipolaris sorokiniana ND90Pr]|uniref:Uncharacterized protein n=1 Tax=Cochliobolus sativus (strain ND90Pr / ATCC 201652) TaxID=665912 RepID=M2SQU1_COCSN|nr:uncharacterized protein COCSADRAFT_176001 [Bipolaris sorokiniana ND90Pr]EMD59481.1 hypothetical protein COCSADRAFT_176001 [Bipolaris sorokiniana ND90Pr]
MAVSETDVWHVTHYAPHILPPTAHGRLAPFALGPVMQSGAINSLIANSLFSHLGHDCIPFFSGRKKSLCIKREFYCLQTQPCSTRPTIISPVSNAFHIHTKAYVIKRGLHANKSPKTSNPRKKIHLNMSTSLGLIDFPKPASALLCPIFSLLIIPLQYITFDRSRAF